MVGFAPVPQALKRMARGLLAPAAIYHFEQEKAGYMKAGFGRRRSFELRVKLRASYATLLWSALIFIPLY